MRYRVISNGDVYRVQYRRCFIWWTWSEASLEEGWGPSPFEFSRDRVLAYIRGDLVVVRGGRGR